MPLLAPHRQDHIDAAELRNTCRRAGIQLGTVDALLAQLCIRHHLTPLTTDNDFSHAALRCRLNVWNSPVRFAPHATRPNHHTLSPAASTTSNAPKAANSALISVSFFSTINRVESPWYTFFRSAAVPA